MDVPAQKSAETEGQLVLPRPRRDPRPHAVAYAEKVAEVREKFRKQKSRLQSLTARTKRLQEVFGKGPRKILTGKQKKLAQGLAAGLSITAAAANAGLSRTRAQQVNKSALFQAAIAEYRKDQAATKADTALGQVAEDTSKNVRFIQDVRDGTLVDNPSNLRVRLQAATSLLDRQLPRKVESKVEEVVTIRIDGTMLDSMRQIIAEDELPIIDITPPGRPVSDLEAEEEILEPEDEADQLAEEEALR